MSRQNELYNEQHDLKNSKGKKRNKAKKKKKDKVMSGKFIAMTLLLALIAFFVCFSIGIVVGPDFPI